MTAKKPRFKPRVGWAVDKSLLGGGWIAAKKRLTAATHSVRVTDARDLTAEQAVQKVFKNIAELYTVTPEGLNRFLVGIGMTATIDENGKVRVMRAKP